MKSVLKVLGIIFIFILLLAIGIIIWFSFESAKLEKDISPFINESLNAITMWEYEEFRTYLTSETQQLFSTEKGQKLLKKLSKLGKLKSCSDPELLESKTGYFYESGFTNYTNYSKFSVNCDLENHRAKFTLVIVPNKNEFLIEHIHVASDLFLE
ncbi:hypothetical protein KKA14_12435 [bacterium]|nr:hypothetical protein [bacterium]